MPFTNHPSLPEIGFIRQAQLIPAIIPFSNATLWRKVKEGSFPAPVKLSPRVTAWEASKIREWIAARAAGAASQPITEKNNPRRVEGEVRTTGAVKGHQ